MKTPRGASESSTTSDNTTEFIDIVKKYDVVYNTHNPDYKNVEVKMKVWSHIAEEIGLSVDASKRKWKNLRDSYTKYLRSFRIGTKTSKKYQYWAHAEHMDFLKPYQGPGRNSANNSKANEEDDTECDLGFQVLTKGATAEEDLKITLSTNPPVSNTQVSTSASTAAAAVALGGCSQTTTSQHSTLSPSTSSSGAATATVTCATTLTTTPASVGALMLPIPSLPTVHLPPQLSSKPTLSSCMPALPTNTITTSSIPAQIFPLPPHLTCSTASSAVASSSSLAKTTIPMPASNTASSVGCLIIEPQLFASADTFKKELTTPALGLFHNIAAVSQATAAANAARINPPLITKIRRVQPSPQTAAINLSFSTASSTSAATLGSVAVQPPAAKARKICSDRSDPIDVSAILQANRDLDANTLFFLSLARTVRSMPMKFQSLAKMRCMRIVSDIELELENVNDCQEAANNGTNGKFCSLDTPPPPPDGNSGGIGLMMQSLPVNDAGTEHFVYVMSPSRVESMIDISSDEEATMNGN